MVCSHRYHEGSGKCQPPKSGEFRNKTNSKQSINFRQKVCCYLVLGEGWDLWFCLFLKIKQKKVGSKHSNTAKCMTTSLPLLPFSGEERMRYYSISASSNRCTKSRNSSSGDEPVVLFFFLNKQRFSHDVKKRDQYIP